MAREWCSVCLDCGEPFSYSDATYATRHLCGQPLPSLCAKCEYEYWRERRALGRKACSLAAGAEIVQLAGLASTRDTIAVSQQFPPGVDDERGKFGVSDTRVLEFYEKLDDPLTQVILVEAPTGAGKSTFFPFRLLEPPPGIRDPAIFTRNGQIVVTQPRIQATRNIPGYVSKLHGCRVGAGYDIGFRYSLEHACDWNCKLVYLTDGTLLNWIAGGQLPNISLIMIDEAHERSLTIDLIIGLLTAMLPRYPWIKLVIASATIDHERFLDFFGRHLRGGTRCERIVFEGKPGMPVRKHFRCGHVEWEDASGSAIFDEAEPAAEPLPYRPDDLDTLLQDIPTKVGEQCVQILERMHPSDDSRERGVPQDLVDRQGDVLVFLYGKKSIDACVEHVGNAVAKNPVLAERVRVLPLHSALSLEEQKRALEKPVEGITRVIVSTNVAETSLTLEGIKHVVETGLINTDVWDTESETGSVRQALHSQAGCRQRWGRAGRVAAGDAWCLYSKAQFDAFPTDTTPAILRSRLEPVVLKAKCAGVDSLDEDHFPWLDPPPPEELNRAMRRLRQHCAIDEHGDVTPRGIEIGRLGGDVRTANLLLLADEFACVVEMATILRFIEGGGRGKLLLSDSGWDADSKRQVRSVHAALTWGCRDDLELVLKVFTAWEESGAGGDTVATSWAWAYTWRKHCDQSPLPTNLRENAVAVEFDQRTTQFTALEQFDLLAPDLPADADALAAWFQQRRNAFQRAASETWAQLWLVNDKLLREVQRTRDERIEMLAVRKKEKERRPLNFESLTRLRLLMLWACPDACFLRTEDSRDDRGIYERLTDRLNVGSRALNEDVASLIEDDLGDEDEGVQPPVLLAFSDRSICRDESPDAVVGLTYRIRKSQPHPNAEEREFLSIDFAVIVDPDWPEIVAQLDEIGLALFLAEHCPPRASREVRLQSEEAVRARLFVDQRYPIFSQFAYEVVDSIDEEHWTIRLVEPVGYWPASRAIRPVRVDGTESDKAEDMPEGAGELSSELLVDIHNDDGQPRVNPAWTVPPEDAEDSDESTPIDEDSAHSDDELEDVHAMPVRDTPTESAPRSISVSRAVDWRPVVAKLRATGDLPPAAIAEVVTYEMDAAGQPTVLLETPTPEISFRLFVQRYSIGDEVHFVAVGHRQYNASRAVGLMVRESETGLETELLVEDLAFVRAARLAKDIEVGTTLRLRVEAIDSERSEVRATLLHAQAEVQAALMEELRHQFVANGIIVGHSKREVIFELDLRRLIGVSPPAGVKVLARMHANSAHKIPLQCEIGRECNITVSFQRYAQYVFQSTPPDFEASLQAMRDTWGPQLDWDSERGRLRYFNNFRTSDGRWHWRFFDDERRAQTLAMSNHPAWVTAVDRLRRSSYTLSASVADPDLERRYRTGQRVRGVLERLGEPPSTERARGSWADVRLDSGIVGRVAGEEHPLAASEGDVVIGTVLATDGRRQALEMTLAPAKDAIESIVDESIWNLGDRLGLLNRRSRQGTLRFLDHKRRAKLAESLDQARERSVPWLGWAQLRMEPGETGRIIGPGGAAIADMQAETGAAMAADRGDVYVLAGRNIQLEAAIQAIQSRVPDTEVVRMCECAASANSDDLFKAERIAPLEQIAPALEQDLDGQQGWVESLRLHLRNLSRAFRWRA